MLQTADQSKDPHPDTQPMTEEKPVASIELDRFCVDCGYNLRTLPVFRDAKTQIPVVRCNECGRYQSANEAATALRPWADRASMLAMGAWVIVLAAALFQLGVAQTVISYSVLDELTVREGVNIQRINGVTIRNYTTSRGALEPRPRFDDDKWFLAGMGFLSALAASATGFIAVVVFPHWRKIGYIVLVLAWPTIAATIVTLIWRSEAPHLLTWGMTFIISYYAIQLLAGLTSVAFGRAFARLIVKLFFPPSLRPRLAYLWYADSKPFSSPV